MKAVSFRLDVVRLVDMLVDCLADCFPSCFVDVFVDCFGDVVDCFVDCLGVGGSEEGLFMGSGSSMGCVGGMPGCILMELGS